MNWVPPQKVWLVQAAVRIRMVARCCKRSSPKEDELVLCSRCGQTKEPPSGHLVYFFGMSPSAFQSLFSLFLGSSLVTSLDNHDACRLVGFG